MDGKAYISHLAGIASLMEWIYASQRAGYSVEQTQDGVWIDPLLGRRFLFGSPARRRSGKNLFIGAQRREAIFLKLLRISRVAVRSEERALHLICPLVPGDGGEHPDIPPFTISFRMESHDFPQIIAKQKRLDCRGFWIDETGEIVVGKKAILWTAPVMAKSQDSPLFEPSDLSSETTFSEISPLRPKARSSQREPLVANS